MIYFKCSYCTCTLHLHAVLTRCTYTLHLHVVFTRCTYSLYFHAVLTHCTWIFGSKLVYIMGNMMYQIWFKNCSIFVGKFVSGVRNMNCKFQSKKTSKNFNPKIVLKKVTSPQKILHSKKWFANYTCTPRLSSSLLAFFK